MPNETSLLTMSALLLTLVVLYSILVGIVAKKHGIGRFMHEGSGNTAAREWQGNNAVGIALVPCLSASVAHRASSSRRYWSILPRMTAN